MQARRLLEDGRAYRAQGKHKQALDNFNIVVSSFPATERGRAGAARDRPLPHGGRGRRRQGARRLRAGDQAVPAERRGAGRLLLPGHAHPEPRHDARRARRRARAVHARRRRLYPRSDWVPRALARTGARAPQGRDATRRRSTSTAGSRSSTRPATRPRRPSSRSAMRSRSRASRDSRDGGVPAGPQPLPAERLGRAGARAHHRALSAPRRREAELRPGRLASPRGRATC